MECAVRQGGIGRAWKNPACDSKQRTLFPRSRKDTSLSSRVQRGLGSPPLAVATSNRDTQSDVRDQNWTANQRNQLFFWSKGRVSISK